MAYLEEITGKAISGEWGDEDTDGNGVPVLRAANFTDDGGIDFTHVVTRSVKKDASDKLLRPGDIILEKSGGSDTKPVGRVAFYDGPGETYLFNNFTGLLRVRDASVWIPKYVFYALFANYARGGTRRYENRTTGIHNLRTGNYVSDTVIPNKPFSEQKKVVSALDKVSGAICLRKRQLAKLDELVKAQFVNFFGDFNINSMNWPVAAFNDFAKIDAVMTTEYSRYANYPHIGIDSIEKDTGRLHGYRAVREDNVMSGKYVFTPQHIIYSKIRPNLNKVALPDFDGLCSADAYPILPNPQNCNRVFLAIVMRSNFFLNYVIRLSSRTNIPKVNRTQITGFKMPLPPLELQERFASFVEQIDKSKNAVQRGLEKLETLKAALMRQYFG